MKYKYPFLEVIADIHRVTDRIVLVGGWVPTVYFEFLWKNVSNPFLTEDIDLGLTRDIVVACPLEERLSPKKYRRRHLHLGREKPYQLMLGAIPIDFLADEKDCDVIHKKILGRGIILNASRDYDFLLARPLVVDCDNLSIRVPQPARYIIHKISVYLQNRSRRAHDAAIAYYTLSRSPVQDKIVEEIGKLKKTAVCRFVGNELPKRCENKNSSVCFDIQKLFLEAGIRETSETLFEYLKKIIKASA